MLISSPLTVIISTSFQRTTWLIERCLQSVYQQLQPEQQKVEVLIVDDNEQASEFERICDGVAWIRRAMNLLSVDFPTQVIRNRRTRFMSGTGAWNTGILEAYSKDPEGFVSLLDDDDAYLPHHLSDCIAALEKDTAAVFQRLFWKNNDGTTLHLPMVMEDLTPEHFFIGNPGIQGSNMFFRTSCLIDIGGFDETLPSTTDRDLMIRFLWYLEKQKRSGNNLNIKVLENIGVVHYNHDQEKVNNNFLRKQQGLDLFYKKYRTWFSEEAYQKSLIRARDYFKYEPQP